METASIVIRNLPAATKQGLREMALANTRSMEAEARQILSAAVAQARESLLAASQKQKMSVGRRIHARFAGLGGVDLVLPSRLSDRTVPDFSANTHQATPPQKRPRTA